MTQKKRGRVKQSTGFTPVRLQGTNTPVQGDSDYAFRKALKLFNRKVAEANIIGEVKAREFYEKPSVRRKREADQARRRELKRQAEQAEKQNWG